MVKMGTDQFKGRRYGVLLAPVLCAAALIAPHLAGSAASPIRFELKAIAFRHENGEDAGRREAPATMAGGVAVFDYNRDGRPDIFFTNGARLATLRKDDPKYYNRLFRNDGNGVFTDVTEKGGSAPQADDQV